VFAVGAIETATIDGATLVAGSTDDLAVVRFEPNGRLAWATAVHGAGTVVGAEVTGTADGGVMFGSARVPDMQFRPAVGAAVALDEHNGGVGWLAKYRRNGTVAFATTIAGTASGIPGEVARDGGRVYLDVVLRPADNTINGTPISVQRKDSSLWAIDLAAEHR
jgi:hypothetical protein